MDNSRVGTKIRTRGSTPSAFTSFMNIGSRYAAVLPVPVCATPTTSAPDRMTGMAFACIGVGCSKPSSSNTFKIDLLTFNSLKLVIGRKDTLLMFPNHSSN
ncbi:hypothetical protein NC99_03580 [Sunxiuqinia dokdonensis]|uniref:Uncharacterized protein n=1 Tax=Sunxiuqinia dokdonensis TaxID=1409788 RepID=A0A0L8VEE9_9BACT|nr:hypothetical protein NC99_03580 [Sunxiuqinia dokdonensis]